MKKSKKSKSTGACRLAPEQCEQWPSENIFNTAMDLADEFPLAFVLVNDNIGFTEYCKAHPKPWVGKSAPKKIVILWDARPMDPAAVLSWRCALIEENNIAYKFLFLPEKSSEDWHEWFATRLIGWARPAPEKEKTGLTVGELVYYNQDSILNQLVDYDPSFLTISPSGKMADVLEQLDECKRMFRDVIGGNVKKRRETIHEVLEQALSFSVVDDDEARRKEFKRVSALLHQEISKQNFLVDRNRLPKVLLLGPSGVGKTLVARYLAWRTSSGQGETLSRPFKRVPIPEYLHREQAFEYDVLGYRAGAYTGANPDGEKGFLLERIGGVLFFDEIGDASPTIQAKLLAYLDDYKVVPRGWSGEPVFCPMLVVAATNLPIDEWAANDTPTSPKDIASYFRNDLFRRFNYVVRVPPLNDRKEELPFILDTMLQMSAFNPDGIIREAGVGALKEFMEFDYDRGNFRDLENMVRTACCRARREGRRYIVNSDVKMVTKQP